MHSKQSSLPETRLSMHTYMHWKSGGCSGRIFCGSAFTPATMTQTPYSPGDFQPGYIPYPSAYVILTSLPNPYQLTAPGLFPAQTPPTPFTLSFIWGKHFNMWSLYEFQTWQSQRHGAFPEEPCPEDILLTDDADTLSTQQ